ncbi:MAG: hypothetical protein IAA73_00795 [Bacteroidetes bacterium]|uniref:Uncharacterized protein n=1 Tax=Candidatus Gallipaludibacter merdavium TaxID=2840839 RepID=A0A9D9HS32_9BACT|nr:hypothetical protein [Candidatus Gallipaludibacter merdavium]
MYKANMDVWEESVHNSCLCYSEAKGFYVSNIFCASKEEVLFLPHGNKGFWKKQVQIQKENLTIQIETNFGYASRTYMRAIVERDGERLLDFDLYKLYILNNCSVMTLDVEPYDWENLFNKIIFVSKGFSDSQYTSCAMSYVEELSNLLDKNEILIKGTLNREKIKWNGEYLVTLFAAKKIRDLIKAYNMANITEIFSGKCNRLYNKFLHKIQEIDIDLSDERTIQIEETLFMIHEFMAKNENGLNFLKHFISKS